MVEPKNEERSIPDPAKRETLKLLAKLGGMTAVTLACRFVPGLDKLFPPTQRDHWGERIEPYPVMIIIEHPQGENVNVHNLPSIIDIVGQTPSNTGVRFEVYKVKGQIFPGGGRTWTDPKTKEEFGVWFEGQSIPNAEPSEPPLTGHLAATFVSVVGRPGARKE